MEITWLFPWRVPVRWWDHAVLGRSYAFTPEMIAEFGDNWGT